MLSVTNAKHKLEITTPYGDRYIVHENGDIERTDIPGFKLSGQWKLIGIESVRSRSCFIRLECIEDELPTLNLKYKNGNPRWTVRDYDHGTFRSWGNTRYHGVASIRVIK